MLTIALVGGGRWGGTLIDALAGSEKARFVAVVSRDPTSANPAAEKHGLPVLSFDQALADDGIQALAIATPHTQHLEQVLRSAAAGKHVFVEKPLALTADDARAMIAACASAGVRMGHGFNRRFSPAYAEIRRRLDGGELGKLIHAEGQFSGASGYMLKPGAWRADPAECPAGAMTARGLHPLDGMIAFCGPVRSVFGHTRRRVIDVPVDDTTSAILDFENGMTGTITSHHATADIWRLQLYGSKAWIEMTGEASLRYRPVGGDIETIDLQAINEERLELEAFADYVTGRIEAFPVPDADVINGLAVLEGLVTSSESGQAVAISPS